MTFPQTDEIIVVVHKLAYGYSTRCINAFTVVRRCFMEDIGSPILNLILLISHTLEPRFYINLLVYTVVTPA